MLKRLKRKEDKPRGDKLGRSSEDAEMVEKSPRASREPRLARSPTKLRVPWRRRARVSEESGLSSSSERGHTPSSSIGGHGSISASSGIGAALTSMAPFPLIRSHSSMEPSPPPKELRGRSLTEGEPPVSLNSNPQSVPLPDPPLPPFDEEETDPVEFLALLESQGRGGRLCLNLAKSPSKFLAKVMHIYISTQFTFTNEAIDIALRKFLLMVKLPLETQQTERVLECFATVYHEQNPWVFVDDQEAYFVVFSIIILHTDFFNKNVKHKMTREDYVRSAYCENIPVEFFEYLYDNTTCAQFIHAEDDRRTPTPASTMTSTITSAFDDSASVVGKRSTSFGWRQDLIVDPYVSILENNAASLRPNLSNAVATTDPFVPYFIETVQQLLDLRERFNQGPTIQLVSQRSRPDAWQADLDMRSNLSTQNLLQITTPGVVEIKVVKLGILMRRESSKRVLYQKSSWKEWGAILTESQLYLFKNVSWVKQMLETQSDTIIRAPIDEFNATTISSTKDMAAVFLSSNSGNLGEQTQFVLTGRGGSQQWFSARDELETIDWILNINFAAAFSTYHVGPVPTATPSVSRPETPLIRSSSESTIAGAKVQPRRQRTEALMVQIREIDRKIGSIQEQINLIERDSNSLQMLMPLQQKTKEMLMFAVGQCSSKCEYCWLDRARLRCYKNILELDFMAEENSVHRPLLSLNTARSGESLSSELSSPILGTPDRFKIDDTTIYHDAPSSPIRSPVPVDSDGVRIEPGRQFSFVQMNPDLVNSSPRSSNKSTSSLQPTNSTTRF